MGSVCAKGSNTTEVAKKRSSKQLLDAGGQRETDIVEAPIRKTDPMQTASSNPASQNTNKNVVMDAENKRAEQN